MEMCTPKKPKFQRFGWGETIRQAACAGAPHRYLLKVCWPLAGLSSGLCGLNEVIAFAPLVLPALAGGISFGIQYTSLLSLSVLL